VHLLITLKPGTWIDPGEFTKQISGAGYAARMDDIRLVMQGKVARSGDQFELVLDDVKPATRRLLLEEAQGKDAARRASYKEAYGQLSDAAGKLVEVEVEWRSSSKVDQPARFHVRSVRVK
jgi:hypothetical protein